MRTNHLLLAIFAVLLSTSAVSAQYFGFRAGVNIANAQVDVNEGDVDVDGVTNLQVGLFLDFPLAGPISVQPELNYVGRGYEYTNSITVGGVTIAGGEKVSIAYLDLGGLLKANFGQDGPVGFYIGAGPYFSYAVSGQVDDGNNEVDIDFDADRVNRSDFSVAGAAGITFGADLKFFADVRYLLGLSDTNDRDEFQINNRSLGITGGVMVPLGR